MLDTLLVFDGQDYRATLRRETPFFYKVSGRINGEFDFHLGGLTILETLPIHDQEGMPTAYAKID